MSVIIKTLDPQICIVDLAQYNSGNIRSIWIELAYKDEDEIKAEIDAFLKIFNNEEWAIHDSNDMPGEEIEYKSISRIVAEAELVMEHGYVYLAFKDYWGNDDFNEEAYVGVYDNMREFAEDRADERIQAMNISHEDVGFIQSNFDYDSYVVEIEIDYVGIDYCGQTYVFDRNW